jgi:hypothetical protein
MARSKGVRTCVNIMAVFLVIIVIAICGSFVVGGLGLSSSNSATSKIDDLEEIVMGHHPVKRDLDSRQIAKPKSRNQLMPGELCDSPGTDGILSEVCRARLTLDDLKSRISALSTTTTTGGTGDYQDLQSEIDRLNMIITGHHASSSRAIAGRAKGGNGGDSDPILPTCPTTDTEGIRYEICNTKIEVNGLSVNMIDLMGLVMGSSPSKREVQKHKKHLERMMMFSCPAPMGDSLWEKVCANMDAIMALEAKFECPDGQKVLEVGPAKPFSTVNEAIDTWERLRVCPQTIIRVDKGTYGPITLQNGTSGMNLFSTSTQPFVEGLTIIGDTREIASKTYINGHTLTGRRNTRVSPAEWTVEIHTGPHAGVYGGGMGAAFTPSLAAITAELSPLVDASNPSLPHNGCSFPYPAPIVGKIGLTSDANAVVDCFGGGFMAQYKTRRTQHPVGVDGPERWVGGVATLILQDVAGPFHSSMSSTFWPGSWNPDQDELGPVVMFPKAVSDIIKTAVDAAAPALLTVTLKLAQTYDPEVGTMGGMVQLTHPGGDLSKIQVDITEAPAGISSPTNPDFELCDLVANEDEIQVTAIAVTPAFQEPFHLFSKRKIVSMSGNVLMLDAALDFSLEDLVHGLGGGFTILPNVHIQSEKTDDILRPAFQANRVSVGMVGLTFEPYSAAEDFREAATIMAIQDSHVRMDDVVVTSANPPTLHFVFNPDWLPWTFSIATRRTFEVSNSFIESNGAIVVSGSQALFEESKLTVDTFIHMGAWGSTLEFKAGTYASIGHLVVGNSDKSYNPSNTGVLLAGASEVYIKFTLDIYGHHQNALVVLQGSTFTSTVGGSGRDPFEDFVVGNPYKFQNNGWYAHLYGELPSAAIQVLDKSTVYLGGSTTFKENWGEQVLVGHGSTFAAGGEVTVIYDTVSRLESVPTEYGFFVAGSGTFDIEASTYAPNNIREYSSDGIIEHVFSTHRLDGGVRAMTLDPSAEVNVLRDDFPSERNELYVGKSYTICNKDGSRHTLTLDTGAFQGIYVSQSTINNQYEFPAEIGHCLRIIILSPSEVSVTSGSANDGKWRTVTVRRRVVDTKKPFRKVTPKTISSRTEHPDDLDDQAPLYPDRLTTVKVSDKKPGNRYEGVHPRIMQQ